MSLKGPYRSHYSLNGDDLYDNCFSVFGLTVYFVEFCFMSPPGGRLDSRIKHGHGLICSEMLA